MMHKKYITIALCFFSLLASAQQMTTNNQYLYQPYLLNPAAAGVSAYNAIHISHKNQWVGFEDNPVTQMFAYQFKKGTNTAFGLRLLNDRAKSFGTTSAQMNYVYHAPLNNTMQFALATGIEMGQLKYGFSDQLVIDMADPVLLQQPDNKTFLNSNFSFFLQGEGFYFGMALPKLFQENYLNAQGEEVSYGSRNLLANGGYFFAVSNQLNVEPSVLLMKDEYTPPSMSLSLKASYQQFLNVSLSLKDFSGVMAGFGFDYKQFMLAYFYAIPSNDLASVSGASHELLLSYKWAVKSIAPKIKKPRSVKEVVLDIAPEFEEEIQEVEQPAKLLTPYNDLTDKVNANLHIKDGVVSRESTPSVMELGSLLLKNKQYTLEISGPLEEASALKTYYVNRWAISTDRILIQEASELKLHLSE